MHSLNHHRIPCKRRLLLAAFTAAALAPGVQGQEWPTRPIRIVVGGPAGGTADALARIVAEGLTQILGKPAIVEAKPGAAGALAVHELLAAPKDGHTLLLIQGGIASETPLAYKVAFDPFKSLKPLVQVSRQGLILVGNNQLPAQNLKELLAYIKSSKPAISYASYAAGMRGHTSGVQLARIADAEMNHVGYKGSPPALQDVMGGHVSLMFDAPPTALPLIKAGKLKAYAVNFPTRISALPEVPTFAELGYPGLAEVGWMGLWSSPDVPVPVQNRLRDAAQQYLRQPKVQERIRSMGMEAGLPLNSEELSKDLRLAYERQSELLKAIQFKPE